MNKPKLTVKDVVSLKGCYSANDVGSIPLDEVGADEVAELIHNKGQSIVLGGQWLISGKTFFPNKEYENVLAKALCESDEFCIVRRVK